MNLLTLPCVLRGSFIERVIRRTCESLAALGNVRTLITTRPLFQWRSCRQQASAMDGATMHCSKVSIQGRFASAYHVPTNMHRFNVPARTLTEIAP